MRTTGRVAAVLLLGESHVSMPCAVLFPGGLAICGASSGNYHNNHPIFDAEIERARREGGRFLGVNRVTRLDSAASRLFQLADVVAYSRRWIVGADLNVTGLRERFGVHVQ